MHKRGKVGSGGCIKEEKPIPVGCTKSGKAGTIMTHRVRETCFCWDLRRQRYRADRLFDDHGRKYGKNKVPE